MPRSWPCQPAACCRASLQRVAERATGDTAGVASHKSGKNVRTKTVWQATQERSLCHEASRWFAVAHTWQLAFAKRTSPAGVAAAAVFCLIRQTSNGLRIAAQCAGGSRRSFPVDHVAAAQKHPMLFIKAARTEHAKQRFLASAMQFAITVPLFSTAPPETTADTSATMQPLQELH